MDGLSHILWTVKNVPNHQPGLVHESFTWSLLIYHPIPNLLSQGRGSNWSADQMCSLLNFCVTLQSAGSQLLVQNHIFLRSNSQKKQGCVLKQAVWWSMRKSAWRKGRVHRGDSVHGITSSSLEPSDVVEACEHGTSGVPEGKTNLVIPGSSLALIKQIPRTI